MHANRLHVTSETRAQRLNIVKIRDNIETPGPKCLRISSGTRMVEVPILTHRQSGEWGDSS